MGNTNCVADGGTPNRADIVILNNTEYDLHLQHDQDCGRDCNHQGWQILEGKIVQGRRPPGSIPSFSTARFSVSGREGSPITPKGRVYYVNEGLNLKVILEWEASGLPLVDNHGKVLFSGSVPVRGSMVRWGEILVGTCDTKTWIYEIKLKRGRRG